MHITRFFETEDGGSRFEDVELAFSIPREDDFGHTLLLTSAIAAPEAVLVELPKGLDQGWHNAPQRQLVCVLDGVVEVETTDGEKRQWSAGGLFSAEDVGGKGHLTRVLEGPARVLFVQVPDAFAVAEWSA
jgi:quercetin dioxygenase-like cupin family protein